LKDFSINIEKDAVDLITKKLKSAVDDSVKQSDIDYAGAQIQQIILLRTSRGKYLTSKTGGTAQKRTYKSDSWKRKRAKKGLPTDRVTLFYGGGGAEVEESKDTDRLNHQGGLLEAMAYTGKVSEGEVTLDVGYIPGRSEAAATTLAGYMNDEGVGINHVLYRYIGLTKSEEQQVIKSLRKRVAKNIQDEFNN